MARRKTFWLGKTYGYQAVSTGTTNLVLATSTTIHAANEDPTLIRIVGRIMFWHERDSGGFKESTRSTCFAGIHCVHEDIVSQNPVSEIGGETWMWQGLMCAQATFTEYPDRANAADTIIGGSTQSRGTQHNATGIEHVDFDIRAMRKAPKPCEVRLMLDVTERLAETGSSHFITAFIRMLFKAG